MLCRGFGRIAAGDDHSIGEAQEKLTAKKRTLACNVTLEAAYSAFGHTAARFVAKKVTAAISKVLCYTIPAMLATMPLVTRSLAPAILASYYPTSRYPVTWKAAIY